MLKTRVFSRRGSILLHVLVTCVISMVIAAGLLRIIMMRYVAVQRVQDGGANKRAAEAAIAVVAGRWNAANASCTTAPAGWVLAGGAPCGCTVTGTVTVAGVAQTVTVQASPGAGGACRLTATTGL